MSLEDFNNRVLPAKNKLYRFALRMVGNTEDAEDILQEVFIKVWNKKDVMHTYLNMEAWCMRLVRNKCLDTMKSRHFKLYKQKQDLDVAEEGHTPYTNTELNNTMEMVNQHINRLPVKQKQVIHLRDIKRYTYQEISEIMKIDMNQVKVNLFRARKAIRDKLLNTEGYGI